ncbi:MAG: hypothetical protein NTZ46_09175 [Verrucomicrobia bacterium]|nr:hypothetical protein [Verrucomicrobiota bacterium]
MKKFPISLLAVLLALAPLLRAQPPANPYDLLSRSLVPIASVFSPEAKQHALSATLVLEQMTDLPPEMAGASVDLLLEPPDRALLRGMFGGKLVTLCRAGDAVWIAPKMPPFDALVVPPAIQAPAKNKKHQHTGLGLMILPIPPQQLALLPILLQAKDLGEEQGLRTLEVKVMTELARGLGVEDWNLRLTLNSAGQPVRLRLVGPGWSLTARVERLEYATSLPAATWQQPADAVLLDARQIQFWADRIEQQMTGSRQ